MFDNDGTLWVEQPLPPQFDFVFRTWGEEVKQRKLGMPYIELVYKPMLELLDNGIARKLLKGWPVNGS